jgi:hypothetical protein
MRNQAGGILPSKSTIYVFNFPPEHVGVLSNRDMEIPISNEEELQYYQFLGQSSEIIKFVVQDIKNNDSECLCLKFLPTPR